jgi:hypothetical protein
MTPALEFKHKGKFKPIGSTEAMDLDKMFEEFLDKGKNVVRRS